MITISNSLRLPMLAFAEATMASRPPDLVVGDGYMERWSLAPYRREGEDSKPNVYIHRFSGDDDDRALHDHPYDNVSVILKGAYWEHVHQEPRSIINGRYATWAHLRREGEVVERKADHAHRIEMNGSGDKVITLFLRGPRVREWGFWCPGGWRSWKEYTDPNNYGHRRGCS